MKSVPLVSWLLSGCALAASGTINAGDTAWLLVSTALVFIMIPGLAFFYGGLTRVKSVLNTMSMSFIAMGIVGVLWIVLGYTLAFGEGGSSPLIGTLANFGLNNIGKDSVTGTIPTYVFVMFQGMFAMITPALISGAVVDRMKFTAYALFVGLWSLLVYSVLAHWVWDANGWLFKLGALDFAGGTVVHISSGVAAWVMAWVLGPRLQSTRSTGVPHSIPLVMLGSGLLWFGWFGFNAGSALAANGTAALAFITTNTAAATALVTWLVWEILRGQKPTAVGAATGAIVGLVAITPAAAFVTPVYAVLIGLLGASASFWVLQFKNRLKVDDVLDVFACHGIGGMVGALLTGVFAFSTGSGKDILTQLGIQALGVLAAVLLSGVGSLVLLKLIDALIGLRVTVQHEVFGMDGGSHAEDAYTMDDFSYVSTIPEKGRFSLSAPVVLGSGDD